MNLHASSLRSLAPHQRREFFARLTDEQASVLMNDWRFWARDDQLVPEGDWITWLILAGRGWGKTKTGAQTICQVVQAGQAHRIALVAETAADARDVMVEGDSGILRCAPPWFRPVYEPSKRKLTWPNGAIAQTFNAVEPDQLRGPQFDFAWSDELAKWRYAQDTWDNLQFGLRLGQRPRQIVTTTPRPIEIIRAMGRDPTVYVTRGRTMDNADNLAASFLTQMRRKYEGTRLGRQELDGEVLEDYAGALFSRPNIDKYRVKPSQLPQMQEVVVAVDPPATSGENADECGIVVVGIDEGQHVYVLEDLSASQVTPSDWAELAVDAYRRHTANYIVAEVNNGGEMVEAVIHHADPRVYVRSVRATRGKVIRAEPVALIYEQGRAHHVGTLPRLEDQMCLFTTDLAAFDSTSPDRVDALVWGVTALTEDRGSWSVQEM